MLLEVPQVAAGGEEDLEHLGLRVVERAEGARGEDAGQLGPAGAAAEPGDGQPLPADGAVAGRPVLVLRRRVGAARSCPGLLRPDGSEPTRTCACPITTSTSSLALPLPMTTSSPAPVCPPDQLIRPSCDSPVTVTFESSCRVIDSEPDSARIRLRPVLMAPLMVAEPACIEGVVDLGDVQQLGPARGHPDLAQVRHALGVEVARGHLHVDDDRGVDAQQQLLAQAQRADVLHVPRDPAQDAEAVQAGAQLAVAGDLQDRAVAAQHVRAVGGQGRDGGLADDPHPAADGADGDPLDPAGVDRLRPGAARRAGSGADGGVAGASKRSVAWVACWGRSVAAAHGSVSTRSRRWRRAAWRGGARRGRRRRSSGRRCGGPPRRRRCVRPRAR